MFDEARLKQLVDAYIDQTLEPAEREELELVLMSSEQARQDFWERVHLHAAAREWALGRVATSMVDATVNRSISVRRSWIRTWGVGIAAAAASVTAALWLGNRPDPAVPIGASQSALPEVADEPQSMSLPVAVLALSADAGWVGSTPAPGAPLSPGLLRLVRGNVRIDFLSGAQMTIRAPSEVELVTEMRARLRSGNIHVFAPPAAEGFTVESGELIAVDRGTEFGMTGAAGRAPTLHVLDGKVDVAKSDAPSEFKEIRGGSAVSLSGRDWSFFPAEPALFQGTRDLAGESDDEQARRLREWEVAAQELSARPDAVIHFPFLKPDPGRSTAVANTAAHAVAGTEGTIVGAERVGGRWVGKGACNFSRSTDRVRFVAPGEYQSLTLMAWVRVDRLPNGFNVLLRADRVVVGTPHWQFDSLGRLRFGFNTASSDFLRPDTTEKTSWDVAVSPPLLDGRLGEWIHVATVYDSRRAVLEHFMNGEKVASHPLLHPIPIIIGAAQIGNSVVESNDPGQGRVNLVGRVDEFALLKEALPEEDIRRYYEKGRP
ncbi:LamG domain-containing protein [Luteolibacter sp. SL250]|uniref:LamG domain-containing protein n=1 Tax=Luteolibacter sp. SL250 TaxID=2995170 RepID=UPI002270CF13|nr:LamG domain-containing protein [Luteolibacter sp. SL250]WAC19791.1 LamG domain-containing protein [Luteolibacter sp. SL250]